MKTGRLVKGDLVGTPVQDQASMGPSSPRLTTIPQPGYLKPASGPICWLGALGQHIFNGSQIVVKSKAHVVLDH